MPRAKTWAGLRRLVERSVATSIPIVLLYQSFVHSLQPVPQSVSVPTIQKRLEPNNTLQGSHYVTNTYLRSDLRENQTGIALLLRVTVIDSRSCAPVENALVEIWGANKDGKYSAEHDGDNNSKSSCSSWLRGGSATDAEGVASFKTIYPGVEPNRAPHLNAIIRSDWYEYANNQTIAFDSTGSAASVGQIFFPDDVNGQVYKDSNYSNAVTKVTKNEADPTFKVQNLSWKADIQPSTGDQDGLIRAHLTISIDLSEPQKYQVESLGSQCSAKCVNPSNDGGALPQPIRVDPKSKASFFQPSMLLILIVNMMVIYNMYSNNHSPGRGNTKDQEFESVESKEVVA